MNIGKTKAKNQAFLDRVRERAKTRTKEQRAALLVSANILDANGDFDSRYFSSETIENDRARQKRRLDDG